NAVDDSNQIGILPARRHEIDQAGDASGRFDIGLEDQSVAAITAARRFDFIRGQETPAAIFFVAEQRREARTRIEARETEPIDRTVATDKRPGLRVTQECVIFDLHQLRTLLVRRSCLRQLRDAVAREPKYGPLRLGFRSALSVK